MRVGRQPDQVGVAHVILGIEHQPIDQRPALQRGRTRALHRQQRAGHRLDAIVLGGSGEIHRGKHVGAVGQTNRWKAHLARHLGQLLRLNGAFQHRIGAVAAKRDESGVRHGLTMPALRRGCQPIRRFCPQLKAKGGRGCPRPPHQAFTPSGVRPDNRAAPCHRAASCRSRCAARRVAHAPADRPSGN